VNIPGGGGLPEILDSMNINQGLQGTAAGSPSEGRIVQAPGIESWLHFLDDAGGISAQVVQKYGGFNPESSTTAMQNFLNDVWFRGSYPNVIVNNMSLPQFVHALVALGCAYSPTIQSLIDPHGVATRAAFNASFRNLADNVYNDNHPKKAVAIGTDVMCNPPGAAAGSGFCVNMFDTLTWVYNNLPSNGFSCIQYTTPQILKSKVPDYYGCV
jgi:hypothetical protein